MEKRFKNGLCLGKFMPIHNGHIHMIREAAKVCEVVHVMVCSRLCEPIDGLMRQYWAKEIFKDDVNIEVILCEDENPQYPEDDENFWQIWHDSVYHYVRELDAVFGSEDYIPAFAECLKVEGVIVDRDRETFPVSGTEVRQHPLLTWNYIPDVVKSYFKKKIAIVGPESTGKTTITKALAEHFEGDYVAEYGREYTETVLPKDLEGDDYMKIIRQQWVNIKVAKASMKPFLFTDTEAIVTKTFSMMYDKIDYELHQLMNSNIQEQVNEFDFYILCYPDIEWEDDGTRDFKEQEERLDHFKLIKDHLDHFNARYIILSGKGEQRTANAIQIVGHMKGVKDEQYWQKLSFERVD